uniref:DNA polymerase delta subunit 3 n=1 Tax=Pseudonaja textilis TaxID=8673 RepID=A0A670ZPC1_PSETE
SVDSRTLPNSRMIVTYKWLSFTLGVHVNQAKQMLYDYVERKRKENAGAQFHVTYLLAGNLVQNGHTYHKVAVVKEDKLEAMKSKFSTLASVHVYSIQKAQLRDSSPLFNTDYDILKANLENCGKFSAICCPAAVTRPVAEGSPAETPAQPTPSTSVPPALNGHAPGAPSKQPAQPMKGIMGMFAAKATSKSKNAHKEVKPETKETPGVTLFSLRAKRTDVSDEEEKGTGRLKKKRRRIKQPQSDSSGDEEVAKFEEDPWPESYWRCSTAALILWSAKSKLNTTPLLLFLKLNTPNSRKRRSLLERRKERETSQVSSVRTCISSCFPVTEKAYESESCTESEEDARTKPGAAHKAFPGAPKKDPKEEKRGTKKGGGVPSKANKQASITGFFHKK